MRLIDADRLMDSLRGNVLIDVTPKLEQAIEQQPTAFDRERVIEEIKDESSLERFEDVGISGNVYGHYSKEVIDTEEAIEIVEKGGIE